MVNECTKLLNSVFFFKLHDIYKIYYIRDKYTVLRHEVELEVICGLNM